MYEQYTQNYGNKVDIGSNKTDKSILIKTLAKKKQEQENLISAISSALIAGMALEATSQKLNTISEEIKIIEGQIDNVNKPTPYRILTYDYVKQLCYNGSKVLNHSSLAEKALLLKNVVSM